MHAPSLLFLSVHHTSPSIHRQTVSRTYRLSYYRLLRRRHLFFSFRFFFRDRHSLNCQHPPSSRILLNACILDLQHQGRKKVNCHTLTRVFRHQLKLFGACLRSHALRLNQQRTTLATTIQ